MKKLFKIVILLTFLIPYSSLFALESEDFENPELDAPGIEQEIEEEEQQEEENNEQEDMDEDLVPLTERLEREEERRTEEVFTGPPMSFFTVLAAILIPSIFIVLAYLIFKFFNF